MTVERMCPTCIGLATLGEEKSITTVRGCAGGTMPGKPAAEQIGQAVRDPVVVQPDVQEAGAGDLGRARQRCQINGGGDLGGQVAGVDLHALARAMQPLAW